MTHFSHALETYMQLGDHTGVYAWPHCQDYKPPKLK